MHNDLEKLRPLIGTLTYNRTLQPREIAESLAWGEAQRYGIKTPIDPNAIVRKLVRLGLLKRTERGNYYPTAAGWDWLESGK